jgi:LPXTG-motif cell wall-anchored protein
LWFAKCVLNREKQETTSKEKTMNTITTKIILAAGMALAMLPLAQADSWNQRTVLTLNSPVEVPGQTLPAGTYVFQLANSQSSRHIVQVFNQDENKVLATFLAIPAQRHHPAEQTIVRFLERPAGSPQAIQAWFYPGKTIGHEFVYPKEEAIAEELPHTASPAPLIGLAGLALLSAAGILRLRATSVN